MKRKRLIVSATIAFILGFLLSSYLVSNFELFDLSSFTALFVIITSTILTFQGLLTFSWMIYAWENPENIERHTSPKEFVNPEYSFTALIPARHEEDVIKDTIISVNKIDYPYDLKEIIVLCRADDIKTIGNVKATIKELDNDNIKLVEFSDFPINKPHSLNLGLKASKNRIITIFDAEDEPHFDIYNIVNSIMVNENVDIVQSGVQLMNYSEHWFSAINVMEYFLWFKSGLHFFNRIGKIAPLGGNTVFFKKEYLDAIGGWDEKCLTEDADIGIRLTLNGAKIRVVYDEQHVTQEETPTDTMSLIKQRTRWNQGFIQILSKGDWKRLPLLRQRLVMFYVLFSPLLQGLLALYLPLALIITFTQKLDVLVTLFSFAPLFTFTLQFLVYFVGLYEFTKSYNKRFSIWTPLLFFVSFYPYQLLLMLSSLRALLRIMYDNNNWEKTSHTNGHRVASRVSVLKSFSF